MEQRELKFRVWVNDWAGGRMTYEDFAVNNEGKVFFLSDDDEKGYITGYSGKQDRIVMQYTGLHDKNGVEIYEGDIVNNDFYGNPIYGHNIIEFYNGCFYGVNLKEEKTRLGAEMFESGIWCEKHLKIIGNKYENPKLLTK